MGNHAAGQAMGKAAMLALKMRTNQPALALLDEICKPYEGCDAEFETTREDEALLGGCHDYCNPDGPLGTLIAEAFAPERNWKAEWKDWIGSDDFGNEGNGNVRDNWYDGPEREFRKRYDLC
jgi:hypothetical protein